MSFASDDPLAGELSPGERLLWSGRPRGGLRLRPEDALMIPFSLVWCGFALFWEGSVLTILVTQRVAPLLCFALFGLPFVAIGLYLVVGRFFADARVRERTFYGVTNERVILVSSLFSRETKSLPLRTMAEMTLTEKDDGSGTISFGSGAFGAGFVGPSWPGARRVRPPSFEMIDGARSVYDTIRKAQLEAGR